MTKVGFEVLSESRDVTGQDLGGSPRLPGVLEYLCSTRNARVQVISQPAIKIASEYLSSVFSFKLRSQRSGKVHGYELPRRGNLVRYLAAFFSN